MPRGSALLLVSALALSGLAGACGSQREQLRLSGDPYAARKRLATELAVRRELDGALAYVEDLNRERPDDVDVIVLRGVILREKGMLNEAEVSLQEALVLDKKRADAHAALGIIYDIQRFGERAEKHHREAARLGPEDGALLNNLGFSLFLRGKFRDAVPILQQAVRKQPTNRRARTNLGFAFAATGDFPRAAREFELGGTPAESKNNLGYAYERQGRLAQAFDLYVEAVRLDPRSQRARENLTHVAASLVRNVPADLPAQPRSPVSSSDSLIRSGGALSDGPTQTESKP